MSLEYQHALRKNIEHFLEVLLKLLVVYLFQELLLLIKLDLVRIKPARDGCEDQGWQYFESSVPKFVVEPHDSNRADSLTTGAMDPRFGQKCR